MIKVIFVNSYPRSGSTLLGTVLGNQHEIAFIGEAKDFEESCAGQKTCACGSDLYACEFWKPVIDQVRGSNQTLHTLIPTAQEQPLTNAIVNFVPFDRPLRLISHLLPGLRHCLECRDNIVGLYKAVCSQTGRTVVCDSSHRHVYASLMSSSPEVDLYVVELVRDGRAVVNSVAKRNGRPAARIARFWRNFHVAQRLLNAMPWRRLKRMRVHYEDFCESPTELVKDIMRFAKLPDQPVNAASLGIPHFLSGSSTVRSRKQIEIRLDDKWRSEMTPDSQAEFETVAGRVNRTLGYS